MSGRIFVDSAAFFALADERDDNHILAVATARRQAREGADLYTSNFVVAETYGLLLNRLDRNTALRTLESIYASPMRLVRATERDETRAREIIRQQSDKDYSLIDAISFAVMERLHIRHAWTYDHTSASTAGSWSRSRPPYAVASSSAPSAALTATKPLPGM